MLSYYKSFYFKRALKLNRTSYLTGIIINTMPFKILFFSRKTLFYLASCDPKKDTCQSVYYNSIYSSNTKQQLSNRFFAYPRATLRHGGTEEVGSQTWRQAWTTSAIHHSLSTRLMLPWSLSYPIQRQHRSPSTVILTEQQNRRLIC